MNIRFFQKFTLIPRLLYLNVSKTGISVSIGKRGFTINIGKYGIRFTAGLPGTGVSVSQKKKYTNQNADEVGRASFNVDRFIGDSSGKKKNDGGVFLGVLLVVAIIVAVLTPFALLYVYFSNKLKYNEVKDTLTGTESDFWVNDEEKNEFLTDLDSLRQANSHIENANDKAREHNIAVNKDGSFSARSKVGKQVNEVLNKYEPIARGLNDDLYFLQNLPKSRWNEFNEAYKKSQSALRSFYFWAVVIIYYTISLGKDSFWGGMQAYWSFATNIFTDDNTPLMDGDIEMITVATILAIASYFLQIHFFNKEPASKLTPIPPEVTLNNIDLY